MRTLHLVPDHLRELYEVHEYRAAAAVLSVGFPDEWADIVEFLADFRLLRSQIVAPGGRKTRMSTRVEGWFKDRGWSEKRTAVSRVVDGVELATETHKVDCYRNNVGFEWEWNSKDSVFVPGPQQLPFDEREPGSGRGRDRHPR